MVTCLRIAVQRTKKELLVSEYMDRSYVVTRRRRVIVVSLISSNSYLFLYKYLTSFRRFSVEDFKISVVPKVAIDVATSVIQTGSSCGGYREG